MKIGILSDTHDQGEMIRQAVELFNRESVDLVFHCGDWVSPFILHFFRGLRAPLRGVFGNNDGDKFRHLMLKSKWGLDLEYEERFIETVVDSKKVAVFHGDYPAIVESLVLSGKYDAVFHGHTHQRVNQMVGDTLSLNPGSLMKETTPKVSGASIAIYNTATHTAEHFFLTS